MVAILCNMYTANQHVNFGMNEKIFVTSYVIILLVLIYLGNWITKEKSRCWRQDSSFWIIAICVVVFLCVARIDPEWIFMEHLLTTVVSIVLLTILGVLVLSKPKEFEETVRVPEQPTILPITANRVYLKNVSFLRLLGNYQPNSTSWFILWNVGLRYIILLNINVEKQHNLQKKNWRRVETQKMVVMISVFGKAIRLRFRLKIKLNFNLLFIKCFRRQF